MISRFARSFLAIVVVLFLFAAAAFFHPPARAYIDPWTGELFGEGGVEKDMHILPYPAQPHPPLSEDMQKGAAGAQGNVIMPKLGNATAKAELGRATWKLLHTMTLRYPESPTPDERDAFESYMYLTARLYPCGECAAEFQTLLKTYPPQTASRLSASLWLCAVHNEVNSRLGKAAFDCSKLDAEYDCGCGDAPTTASPSAPPASTSAGNAGAVDPDDLEWDVAKDDMTGVRMIKGGR